MKYNIQDPTFVFCLIHLNGNYKDIGNNSGQWYFIRVYSIDDTNQCPLNSDFEELLIESKDSIAAQEVANREGANVIAACTSKY